MRKTVNSNFSYSKSPRWALRRCGMARGSVASNYMKVDSAALHCQTHCLTPALSKYTPIHFLKYFIQLYMPCSFGKLKACDPTIN